MKPVILSRTSSTGSRKSRSGSDQFAPRPGRLSRQSSSTSDKNSVAESQKSSNAYNESEAGYESYEYDEEDSDEEYTGNDGDVFAAGRPVISCNKEAGTGTYDQHNYNRPYTVDPLAVVKLLGKEVTDVAQVLGVSEAAAWVMLDRFQVSMKSRAF